MQCTDLLTRWHDDQTPLSCVAELHPDAAVMHIPSGRLRLDGGPSLVSGAGSAVLLPRWEDAAVETDGRGTRLELTYPHATVTIRKEVPSR